MSSLIITGGTGSFGQAFVKNILHNPDYDQFQRIVIFSRDEHKQEKMQSRFNSDRLRFFLGDIRDKDRLKLAIKECTYMVHAAALKIVPAGEYNPQEFVKTNVLGAQNIIEVALEQNIRILALSTDKAVNPLNLYGATKLCMEKLFLASNNLVRGDNWFTRFSIVRYGNVANSNGSVIPVFKRALLEGKPFPITHNQMTRFWIELDEAAKFVADNLLHMKKGEVYIPDMPSFKVTELARAFNEDGYVDFEIIGVRPGEKLHEQIDENRFSHTNQRFLEWYNLREKLISLGVV